VLVFVILLEGLQVLEAPRRAVLRRRVAARVRSGALREGAPQRADAPTIFSVERVVLLHLPYGEVPVHWRWPSADALRGPALRQLGSHALLRQREEVRLLVWLDAQRAGEVC
jgi:hypothetical protein